MSVFKQRRFGLLLLAVLISVMLVWKPWAGLEPQARGLNFGVDIAGGSRIILQVDASHVTIEITDNNLEGMWNTVQAILEENLNTTVTLISEDQSTGRIVVGIGKLVTESFVQTLIGDLGSVVATQENTTQNTQDDIIYALQTRLDPYGTLGTQFRRLGGNRILFESAGLDSEHTKKMLTTQGRLEIFIDNEIAAISNDIEQLGSPTSTGAGYVAHLPIQFTEDGVTKFNTAASGKASRPSVVYLDRPFESILVFDNEILNELDDPSELYDENARMFRGGLQVSETSMVYYYILVSAVGTSTDNLSSQALEYLEGQVGLKLKVIFMGDATDFSASVIESIPELYQVEYISRLSGESVDEWIRRVCGVVSASPIGEGVATYGVSEGLGMPIVGKSPGAALQEARDLRTILSNKLPADMSLVSETEVEAHLGDGFVREILVTAVTALAGVLLLIYFRYRRWKICLAIAGITICELVITLGAASALGISLGLSELAGLLVVIGTGIDHQLIVTDEMLQGLQPQSKNVSVGWRASRALPIVYAAIFIIIVAMVPLAWLGIGAIRGFAIITISGTVLALLFTRPIYVRIINTISAS